MHMNFISFHNNAFPCLSNNLHLLVYQFELTHFGLVTQYGDIYLDQLWLRQCFVASRRQAFTAGPMLTYHYRLPMSCGVHPRANSQEILTNLTRHMRSELTLLKLLPLLSYIHQGCHIITLTSIFLNKEETTHTTRYFYYLFERIWSQ